MHLMQPHHPAEVAKRRAALEAAEKHHANLPASREAAFEAWLAATPNLTISPVLARYPLDAVEGNKSANVIPDGKPASVSGGQLAVVPGVTGQAVEFDGDTVLQLDGVAGITRHDPLSITLRIFCPDPKERAVILHSGPGMYSQAADASGFELLLEKGRLRWSCIHLWPGCAASIETSEPFPVGKWVQVTVTYDGSSRADGLKMYFDGKPADKASLPPWMPAKVGRALARKKIKKTVGKMEDYGLPKPDHRPLDAHPSVSGEFLTRVGCGDITPKGAIDRLDGDGVVFADGSHLVEPSDADVKAKLGV
jgi:hypothetical protein